MNSLKFYAIILLAFFIYEIKSQYYTTPKNYVYYINSTNASTWFDALIACNARGEALATLDSQEKYDDFYLLWKSLTTKPRLWIGSVGFAGNLVWLLTGKPIIPSLWNDTQPNGALYNQSCGQATTDGMRGINDYNCNFTYGYICESRGCCKNSSNVLLNILR